MILQKKIKLQKNKKNNYKTKKNTTTNQKIKILKKK